MSAIATFGDEPVPGLGPSTARAFLHALARRLNRAATSIEQHARSVARHGRRIASGLLDTVSNAFTTAFRHGGLQASTSLLLAGTQLVAFAARALGRLMIDLTRRSARALPALRESLLTGSPTKLPLVVVGLVVGLASLRVLGAIRRWRQVRAASWASPDDAGIVLDLTDEERARLTTSLFVVLGTDGAVRVHGIPASFSPDDRATIAETAARAAEKRLEILVARGRPLTELDMCAINIAARNAVTRLLDGDDLAA
jgi:hypothetical protein